MYSIVNRKRHNVEDIINFLAYTVLNSDNFFIVTKAEMRDLIYIFFFV